MTTRNKKSQTITLKAVDPTLPGGVTIAAPAFTTLYLNDGEKRTLALDATLLPSVEDREPVSGLTWTSSAPKVLSVGKTTGVVTALKAGTAKITVTTRNKKSQTITLKAIDPTLPKGIVIGEPEKTTLFLNETMALDASLVPEVSDREPVSGKTWTSSNAAVLSVDKATGVVTALKAGTATVTVATRNSKKDSVVLTVVDPNAPAQVTIDQGATAKIAMSQGKTLLLSATMTPTEGFELDPKWTVTWSSSNLKVAKVNKITGLVTALKAGTTKITVTTGNNRKATIVITVTK